MKTHYHFSILILVALLGSCNKRTLDSETAKKLIIQEYKLPKVIEHSISTGDPLVAKRMLDLGLERVGLVKIVRTQTLSETGNPCVIFTDKGKQYFLPTREADKKYNRQNVKIADADFGKIIQISMNKETNAAVVEYTIVYKNINPFSRLTVDDWTKAKIHRAYITQSQNKTWALL